MITGTKASTCIRKIVNTFVEISICTRVLVLVFCGNNPLFGHNYSLYDVCLTLPSF